MIISDRIAQISASPTLAMAAKAASMKAAGENILSMSLGEPDFPTPAHVKQAVKEAVDADLSHYGPVPGTPGLRAAAAKYMSAWAGKVDTFAAEDIIVSVGAKQSICNAIETLVGKGDEVILPTPCWVSYSEMVKVAEGKVVNIATRMEDQYCLTPDQLRKAITPKTKLLLLCTPNNPTGSVYSRKQLDELVAVLEEHPHVAVLADEIYSPLVYGVEAVSFAQYPQLADRLIVINGVSKAYAMTGYRIGWLLCKDADFISGCARLQGQQITCATMVAQKAAEAAMTGSQDCVEEMRKVFEERKELICRLAADIPGFKFDEPEGAFYLFPNVSALGTGDEIAEYLLEKAHVACVSGSAFGCDECIRLSYAISTEEIKEAMRRIKEALAQYKK